ncbi:class I SAM-dependent methyltransferase, partial [Streptomyces sp. NPDC056669]|uniref:class I SAM-dependent methyltransferase n=1 Tax=Streptomyces sp. NPDC056669 TaxID=3345903 RepID=UPI00368FD722
MTVISAVPTLPVGALFSQTRREFASWYSRLWGPLGALATGVSRPRPGERVLDACCGSGASALPAARAVGAAGHVDAVDMAGAPLDQGPGEAVPQGHAHQRLHRGDFTPRRADAPN